MKSVPQRYEGVLVTYISQDYLYSGAHLQLRQIGSLTQKSQNPTQYMLVVLDRKNVLTLRHEIMFYWPLLGLVFWWPLIYNSLFNSLHFLTSSCENFTNIFYLDQKNVWSLRNEGVGWLSASLIKGVIFCNLGLFKKMPYDNDDITIRQKTMGHLETKIKPRKMRNSRWPGAPKCCWILRHVTGDNAK